MFIHNSLKVYGKYVSEKESVHGVTYILTFEDGTTALILERLSFFFKSLIFLCFYIYVKGRIALVTDSEEEEDDVYNL